MSETIFFEIDHLDPLGQGVYKSFDGEIYFINKTLPGETGRAEVFKSIKKVHFAKVKELSTSAKNRIKSRCEHFSICGGCHYLHTDYQSELQYKTNTLARSLRIDSSRITVCPAPDRHFYRNRIQLHYDIKKKLIGFKNSSQEIIPVPNCLLPNFAIKEYREQHDLLLLKPKDQPNRGHVEIYHHNEKIHVNWNSSYAKQGFTQVNSRQSPLLKEFTQQHIKSKEITLELFCGNGHLSEHVIDRVGIDKYTPDNPCFIKADLFKSKIEDITNRLPSHFDALIIDPPRSGFKQLHHYIKYFKFKKIVYISCQHQTLLRDMPNPDNYRLVSVVLVDLFPGTYHFETMMAFERIN